MFILTILYCSKEIKNAWEYKKSIQANFEDMGLSFDPNKTLQIPNNKKPFKTSTESNKNNEWQVEELENETVPKKVYVAQALEQDARATRVKLFRLPKGQVEWITYLMDKYGNDYKAMARDKKNYNQETWKQLRAKIKRFKSIPEQYSKYLEAKGLTKDQIDEDGENNNNSDSD